MGAAILKGVGRKLKPLMRYDSFWVLEIDLTPPIPEIKPRLKAEFRVASPEDAPLSFC